MIEKKLTQTGIIKLLDGKKITTQEDFKLLAQLKGIPSPIRYLIHNGLVEVYVAPPSMSHINRKKLIK